MAETPITEERRSGNAMPGKVFQLRQKLGQKAKQEPEFRFYALYDRICRTKATCARLRRDSSGEPDAGNPHVRFDEGRGTFESPPTLPAPKEPAAKRLITEEVWEVHFGPNIASKPAQFFPCLTGPQALLVARKRVVDSRDLPSRAREQAVKRASSPPKG